MDAKNSLVGDELTRPPSAELRHRLQIFVGTVERLASHPAAPSQIESEIGGLMISYRSAKVTAEEAKAISSEYQAVLAEFPIWAIREGFRRVKNAEIDGMSPDFPPSAPRLKLVVADVIRPLLADRYEVKRVLNARVAAPENRQMANRVQRLTKAELLQKYGPDFGLGGVPPANEAHRVNELPAVKQRQVMTSEELVEHYRTHGLGRVPKPVKRNDDRYGDRYDGVTSPDDVIDESGAA